MFTMEEAGAVLEIIKEYLLWGNGDLTEDKRRACGRLISEVQYTMEAPTEKPDPPPDQAPALHKFHLIHVSRTSCDEK